MKNIIFKFLTLTILFMVLSCDVTDLKPVNNISENLAFSSAKNVELSMVGLYDAIQSGFYAGSEVNDRGYIFGASHIQQGDMRGEDFVLINVFFDLTYRATYTTTTANNVNYWENVFRDINIANLVMEGVQKAETAGIIDGAAASAYMGEARLIRAIVYHTALIHFARPYLDGNGSKPGLPIFTTGVNGASAADAVVLTSRSSVAEVYSFILADLNFAEQNLPETRDAQKKVTRATKGAAIALKTRVYQHMGDWANVKTEANKIVSASGTPTSPIGGYALGGIDAPWANNTSSDCIFSMEMAAGTDNLNTNAALARMLGSTAAPFSARGEYAISPIMWNQTFWHANDLRRSTTLVKTGGTAPNVRYFTHKYRDYVNWTDYAPIIRYAEVVLTLAEAESRTSVTPSTRALQLLNAIRDRAKAGTMISYVAGDFIDGKALTQSILNERRIELLAEGHRWPDIHRLAKDPDFVVGGAGAGIPAKMNVTDASTASYTIGTTPVKAIAAIPYDDFRFLWPIPQSETTRNATLAAEQNPGY